MTETDPKKGIHRITAHPCPVCSHTLDSAGVFIGAVRPPKPGDFTMCLNCAHVLRFDAETAPRKLTEKDREFIQQDERIRTMLAQHLLRIYRLHKVHGSMPPKGSDFLLQRCYVCGDPNDLRPYGKGGQPICHPCANNDPERKAEAHRQVDEAIRRAGPVPAYDPARGFIPFDEVRDPSR